MVKFKYLWAKIMKKIRGVAVIRSDIHKTSKVESGSQIVDSTFDKHSFCGYDCQIIATDIGSYTSISNNVIIGGGQHPINWVSMSPVFYEGKDSVKAKFSEYPREPVKRTSIGHDVWIGQGALIKQGIKIGNGAVVGMGSVVTKDVLPYTVVAGNPAKKLKNRFDEKIAEEIDMTRWWELDELELKNRAIDIRDPLAFIERFKL